MEILRHSGLVVLFPLSTAVGQNFKHTVWIRQQLTNKQSLHQGATRYQCQLVPSPLRSCNWCQAIPQLSFYTQMSYFLYYTLVSTVICISCLYLLLSLWYAYIPPLQNAGACLQQFTNVMPHCIKHCFIHLIPYTTVKILVLYFLPPCSSYFSSSMLAFQLKTVFYFQDWLWKHIQKANVYMGAWFPLL